MIHRLGRISSVPGGWGKGGAGQTGARIPAAKPPLSPRASQGDGEVAGTAIECGMTTELQLGLVTQRPVPGVHAETPAGQVTFGFS
ncbi:MAG TPA: hypothetical protein VGI74_00740, partial [Streptosporangiaceae bacterium]